VLEPNEKDRAACKRKIRHRTESKALVVAAKCAAMRNVRGLHVYRCPVCSGWHLTHQERARRG
jgi:hypothetical protein